MNNFLRFSFSVILIGPGTLLVLIFAGTEVFFHSKIAGYINWTWLMLLGIIWLGFLFTGVVLCRKGKRRL